MYEQMLELFADVSFAPVEATSDAAAGPKRFNVLAYAGGAIVVRGYDLPVVIDLAGMTFSNNLIANLDHSAEKRVGHVDTVDKSNGQLKLGGYASASTPARDEVVRSASEGFTWQASIEAMPTKLVEVAAGNTVQVNGQTLAGPLYVATKSVLRGFAFVSHGADDNTSVSIAADFDEYDLMEFAPLPSADEVIAEAHRLAGIQPEALDYDQGEAYLPAVCEAADKYDLDEYDLDVLADAEYAERAAGLEIVRELCAAARMGAGI